MKLQIKELKLQVDGKEEDLNKLRRMPRFTKIIEMEMEK